MGTSTEQGRGGGKKKKAIAAFLKTQLQLVLTYLKRVYSRVFKNAAIAFQSIQLTQGSIAAFSETRLQETFELRFRCGYRTVFLLLCHNL